jgi:hypothetical protein
MRNVGFIHLLFFFSLLQFPVFSSPVRITHPKSEQCSEAFEITPILFSEWAEGEPDLQKYSEVSANSRYNSILCWKKSIQNKEELRSLLDEFFMKVDTSLMLESKYYFIMAESNFLPDSDLKEIPGFLESKYNLYQALRSKTEELFYNNENLDIKIEIQNIYYSLILLQRKFQARMKPQTKEHFLKEIYGET